MQRGFLLTLVALLMLNLALVAQGQNGYAMFYDPKGMFCIQVPQGWPVQGESYTDSTSGLKCYYVDLVSPDQSIIITFGDQRVEALFPQMSGREYAQWYYQNFIASNPGVQVVSVNDLQDGSSALEYTDGSIAGVVCAKTMSLGGNKWGLSRLWNVVAPLSEINQVVSIAQYMSQTIVWNNRQTTPNPNPLTQDGFENVFENGDNVREHAINRWNDALLNNPDTPMYIWDCDGQKYTTYSYVPPRSDCTLEY